MFLATYAGIIILKKNLSDTLTHSSMYECARNLFEEHEYLFRHTYGRPDLRRCQPTLEACSTMVFTSWLKFGLGLGLGLGLRLGLGLGQQKVSTHQ
jgi:hypothetical protein